MRFLRHQTHLDYSLPLWRNPSFVLLWSGRSISFLGTIITYIVFPILVYQLTHSPLLTALLQVCTFTPYVLFGLFAGAIADRSNRKRVMILSDSLNILLLGSIPVAALLHHFWLPHIFFVVFFSEAAYVWYDAANFGAVPAVVGRAQIVQATSAMETSTNLLNLVGPSLAGLLIAQFGPALAISADAMSYALSAASLLLIPRAFQSQQSISHDAYPLPKHFFGSIREGWSFVWSHPLVRLMTLLGIGNNFTAGAVQSLLVVYAVRSLGLAPTDSRLGLLFTAGAVGALAASVLLPLLVKFLSQPRITLLSLSLTPVMLLGMTWATQLVAGLLFYGLWNACFSLTIINGVSLRQQVIPDHLQGRVNATARMVQIIGLPLGAACAGLLAQISTVRIAYLVLALGVTLSALLGWFSPLRTLRQPDTTEVRARAIQEDYPHITESSPHQMSASRTDKKEPEVTKQPPAL